MFKSLKNVADKLGCSIRKECTITNACVDTRLLQRGDLFFALGGERTDGHKFLHEVAVKGGCAAVVRSNYAGDDYGLQLLKVRNPLLALQELAKETLVYHTGQVVGITGSVGKTTTKEFLHTLLKQKYRVACTPGNYNSQISLPLTILNHVKGDEEVIILEMGMTHAGHIRRLVDIAPPDIALITAIDLVHACNFDSIEGIAHAKSEILEHPETQLGIIPITSPQYPILRAAGTCLKRTYGIDAEDADVMMTGNRIIQSDDIVIDLDDFPFTANHLRHNFLAAATCAKALGMTWIEIKEAIPHLKLHERRFELVERQGIIFVNDSYNIAVPSMRAAMQNLPQPKQGGRKIAVITEIGELGKFSHACNREVGEIALKHVDMVICMGNDCAPMVELLQQNNHPVTWCKDRQEMVSSLKLIMTPGDVVLLKGRNIMQLWKVLEEI